MVVESLADEFDVMEVALAAVKLAHDATGGAADEEEIPEVALRMERAPRRGRAPAPRHRSRAAGAGGG